MIKTLFLNLYIIEKYIFIIYSRELYKTKNVLESYDFS